MTIHSLDVHEYIYTYIQGLYFVLLGLLTATFVGGGNVQGGAYPLS